MATNLKKDPAVLELIEAAVAKEAARTAKEQAKALKAAAKTTATAVKLAAADVPGILAAHSVKNRELQQQLVSLIKSIAAPI